MDGGYAEINISGRVHELRVLTSRSHMDSKTLEFLEELKHATVIQAGRSVKLCLIAEGSAEVYPRFGRTMEWDTAAGQAVLEAAGGTVVVAQTGEELTYGKPGFENHGFIAFQKKKYLRAELINTEGI